MLQKTQSMYYAMGFKRSLNYVDEEYFDFDLTKQ
jgi:hypothetical protein